MSTEPIITAPAGAPSSSSHPPPAPPTTTSSSSSSSTSATSSSSSSSLDSQIERLRRCEYLREDEVKALCLRAREILVDEGNVQRVDAPVTVS